MPTAEDRDESARPTARDPSRTGESDADGRRSFRRTVLSTGALVLAAVAGCSGPASNDHVVTVANEDDVDHRVSIAVSPADDHGLVYDGAFTVPPDGLSKGSFSTRAIRRNYRLAVWLDGNAARHRTEVSLERAMRMQVTVDDEATLDTRLRDRS